MSTATKIYFLVGRSNFQTYCIIDVFLCAQTGDIILFCQNHILFVSNIVFTTTGHSIVVRPDNITRPDHNGFPDFPIIS